MNFCRVCEASTTLIDLLQHKSSFQDVTGIILRPEPSFICSDCLYRLNAAQHFREQALLTDLKFQEIKIEIDDVDSTEELLFVSVKTPPLKKASTVPRPILISQQLEFSRPKQAFEAKPNSIKPKTNPFSRNRIDVQPSLAKMIIKPKGKSTHKIELKTSPVRSRSTSDISSQ